MKFFFTLICFCLTASFISMNAAEVTDVSMSDNASSVSNCITVSSDRIHLTKDGMFVHIDQEFILISSIYFDGVDQYRCDIHNRLDDLITCYSCGTVYDRYQHKTCPNRACPSRGPGPRH